MERIEMRTRSRYLGVLAIACCASAPAMSAQDYPARPIRMVIGFAPGGTSDIVARILAPKLTERFRQPIVIDNRPGAGSAIASHIAAKAAPDGHTLVMISLAHAINAGLQKNLPYESQKDFAGVALVATAPLVLVVNNELAAKSVSELVALARAKPRQLNFGSSGIGGSSHLAAELLKWMAKLELTHVPYKGAAPALTDLMSGELQLLFPSLPTALPLIKAGRVRALGVTSAKRAPSLAHVPAIAEAVPGYEATNWYALLAPARTPKQIVETLNAATVQALRSPDVTEALVRQGADPMPSTPAEADRYLKTEIAKWTTVIQEAGIRPE